MSTKCPGQKHCKIFPIDEGDVSTKLKRIAANNFLNSYTTGVSYSVAPEDDLILVTAVATISLGDVTTDDYSEQVITIKRTGAAGVTTITPHGAQTIDGDADYTLDAQYDFVTLANDDANWHIIAHS